MELEGEDGEFPDYLTCGICLQHFRLEHIMQFIQHKSEHLENPIHRRTEHLEPPTHRRTQHLENLTQAMTENSTQTSRNRRENQENQKQIPTEPKPLLCCSLCQLSPKSPDSLLRHLKHTHNVNLCWKDRLFRLGIKYLNINSIICPLKMKKPLRNCSSTLQIVRHLWHSCQFLYHHIGISSDCLAYIFQ